MREKLGPEQNNICSVFFSISSLFFFFFKSKFRFLLNFKKRRDDLKGMRMVYIVSEFIFYINILYSSLNINAPVEEDIKNPLNHSLKLKNQTIVILKKKTKRKFIIFLFFIF
jgi:hypothetical protein